MSNYRSGDRTFVSGVQTASFSSNLSRTDTSAREMFVLPPRSVIKQVIIYGVRSDAGTSARISISSTGGGAGEFIANFNVKGNGPISYPSNVDRLWAADDPNPIIVTGVYAEDGGASTLGGPYTILFEIIGSRS